MPPPAGRRKERSSLKVYFISDPDFFSRFDVLVVRIFASTLLVYELGRFLASKLRRPRRRFRVPRDAQKS